MPCEVAQFAGYCDGVMKAIATARRAAEEAEQQRATEAWILQVNEEIQRQSWLEAALRRLEETQAELIRTGDLLGQARARRTEAQVLLEAATEAYLAARADENLTGEQREWVHEYFRLLTEEQGQ